MHLKCLKTVSNNEIGYKSTLLIQQANVNMSVTDDTSIAPCSKSEDMELMVIGL